MILLFLVSFLFSKVRYFFLFLAQLDANDMQTPAECMTNLMKYRSKPGQGNIFNNETIGQKLF